MGTRAITKIYEGSKDPGNLLLTMYSQWDGYPDGLGVALAQMLVKAKFGNGISGKPVLGEFYNGGGCGAASIISQLKKEPGGYYICHPSARIDSQEYGYEIVFPVVNFMEDDASEPIMITLHGHNEEPLEMTPEEFLKTFNK